MKAVIACLVMFVSFAAGAREIPIRDFFKDAEFSNVSLSPSGEYITVSKPEGDRTLLAAFRVSDMKLVGKWDYGANKHIERVRWVNDERFFMFVSFKVGRFDFRIGTPDVFASNVDGTRRIDVPNGGTYSIVDTLDDDPRWILVQRSIDSAFLSKMDVYTGRVATVATAPLRHGGFLVDNEKQVRYAVGQNEKLESVTLRRVGDGWETVHTAEMGGSTRTPIAFSPDNRRAYYLVSETGEPAAITLVDPETGGSEVVSRNDHVSPQQILKTADDSSLLAVSYADGLPAYEFIDKTHPESKLYAGLVASFPEHAVAFRGASKDGRYILLSTYSDIDPGSYYLFDKKTNEAKFLLAARSWIKPAEMSPMRPISLTARDGVKVHGYLTVPRQSDGKNLPLILHPHGGPHGPRDDWGFNEEVQFLANRGYAVLQVNFRGSGGYGNKFERIGYRNWGTTMIDDMTDAVDWTIRQGIADPDRICTYGASYGGYAALQSVVRNPEKYQCAIGYVGVYSLPLMFKDGDIPQSESGRTFLQRVMPETLLEQQSQSPAYNIEKIRIPVMLVQGGQDVRVPPSQYRLLKSGLQKAGRPIEVDVYESKEAHGFYDLDNQVKLYEQMERFLDRHIGQRRAVALDGN